MSFRSPFIAGYGCQQSSMWIHCRYGKGFSHEDTHCTNRQLKRYSHPQTVARKVDYITGRAAEGDARCVTLGKCLFFSTESGDAWMLDAADGLALCLARDGVCQPVRIIETETMFAVEWSHDFTVDDDCFTTMEKESGRLTTVFGYPTQAILEAIQWE